MSSHATTAPAALPAATSAPAAGTALVVGLIGLAATAIGVSAIMSVQAGMPRNIKIAHTSWKRLIGSSPGRSSSFMYCMLPWHQRTSRLAKSSIVGGFSSQLPRSSGNTRTSKPARRISVASTWSWLST